MTNNLTVEALLNQLEQIGLPPDYIRSHLPNWWNDKAAEAGTGLAELELILIRQFGLDGKTLFDESKPLSFDVPETIKYKRSIRYDTEQLIPATAIALSCARIASAAATVPLTTEHTVESIRQHISQELGAKWISLKGLIMYCWMHGIPVIYIEDFPPGCKMMDGMVVDAQHRPVIVISKQTPYSAWLLFILAHELGHIALGHVDPNEILVDETFDEGTEFLRDPDTDEMDATNFALQLLGGGYELPENLLAANDPRTLANAAMRSGRAEKVDPGHILLRNAFETNRWQLCLAAIQVLQGTQPHGNVFIKEGMSEYLDRNTIPKSNYRYLLSMAGIAEGI